jgi:hypothetical protein
MFSRKKKLQKRIIDVESEFAAICSRYELLLRGLVSEWEILTEKWDAKAATIGETVTNETNQSWLEKFSINPQSNMKAEFTKVSMYVFRIKKSIRREFKLIRKAYDKQNVRILKTRIDSWLDELIGTSDLSIHTAFLSFKIEFRAQRYGSKLNKHRELKKNAAKAEAERNRVWQVEARKGNQKREQESNLRFQQAEEIRLTCKTCKSSPSMREERERNQITIDKILRERIKAEQRTRKGEKGMADALKWNMRFGEAALIEMNSRQREQTSIDLPSRCPECRGFV